MWITCAIFVLTVGQPLVATFAGLPQFANKGFEFRLVVYPALMLALPIWWFCGRSRDSSCAPPYSAFALVMTSFLVDVTGNMFNPYDTVPVWDDGNHFVNWLLLMTGIGLLVFRDERPAWRQILVITAVGALLAVLWELGEWYTFIRRGVELDGAYQDTLADEFLGTLGALSAGLFVAWRCRADRRDAGHDLARASA